MDILDFNFSMEIICNGIFKKETRMLYFGKYGRLVTNHLLMMCEISAYSPQLFTPIGHLTQDNLEIVALLSMQ